MVYITGFQITTNTHAYVFFVTMILVLMSLPGYGEHVLLPASADGAYTFGLPQPGAHVQAIRAWRALSALYLWEPTAAKTSADIRLSGICPTGQEVRELKIF